MKIAKTTYEKMGYQDCPRCFPGVIEDLSEAEAAAYLNVDPDHAILVAVGSNFVGVWRGWRGDLKNFYVQALPLERKEDAKGGNATATQALSLARILADIAFIEKGAR